MARRFGASTSSRSGATLDWRTCHVTEHSTFDEPSRACECVAVAALVSYLAARRYGGNSMRKRQFIFSVVSLIGLTATAVYIYIRMA